MITLKSTCELELYFLGYKYWMVSLMVEQELKQSNFELLQTFLNNLFNDMPAYQTSSSSSSSSLSSYSGGLTCYMQATDTMLMTFSEYLEQFKSNNTYTDLMVTLFERQDLIIKTNEMKHLAGMVEHFQNKISHLQEYMQESFDTMEAGGPHQLLKK